ncbi:MAG: (d)CMP kinase [Candidatus Lernaella stagnicola]|nr:(d)CMP kinase [Candidatus Lernaella stagnicola]
MTRRQPIVAIDGPSGAGKSTISKLVAERLGFVYLDTGAMYRCVGWLSLEQGIDPLDEAAVATLLEDLQIQFVRNEDGDQRVVCNGRDITSAIREHRVSQAASKASSLPRVREKLVAMQRDMGVAGGVVMEGRDIGTNVFPDAEIKVFLTATAEERARRRVKQLVIAGREADFDAILADQIERDRRDSQRDLNPLVQAADAVVVDSTEWSIDRVVSHITALAEAARHVYTP